MLPPEVIDHILGFLQWDRDTLEVCADAHPSLSKLVERHFYRHLIVHNFGYWHFRPYDHSDLLKRIADNPNIANHVRSLRIYVALFRDYQALESILPMLTQLQVISLSSNTGSIWDNLRESFRTAFTNCLRLPTVTHVKLSNIDGFPLSALDHSISLKRLSLWRDVCYLPPASVNVYPPLDFLDLYICSSTSMEIIASWLQSRGLHSLRLTNSFERSSRLFEVCANTLTTLHVDVPFNHFTSNTPGDPPTPIPLCLSYLPHLARLRVQAPTYFARHNHSSGLPAAMLLLDTLPSPPTNLVLLVIVVEITIGTDNSLDVISDTNWSPLISFPYFDAIPRVELQVRAHKLGTYLPSVELLKTLKQDPQLMQLEIHPSFVVNAVENPVGSTWFDFGSDFQPLPLALEGKLGPVENFNHFPQSLKETCVCFRRFGSNTARSSIETKRDSRGNIRMFIKIFGGLIWIPVGLGSDYAADQDRDIEEIDSSKDNLIVKKVYKA